MMRNVTFHSTIFRRFFFTKMNENLHFFLKTNQLNDKKKSIKRQSAHSILCTLLLPPPSLHSSFPHLSLSLSLTLFCSLPRFILLFCHAFTLSRFGISVASFFKALNRGNAVSVFVFRFLSILFQSLSSLDLLNSFLWGKPCSPIFSLFSDFTVFCFLCQFTLFALRLRVW